jgi:hypothetical protein
MYWKITPTGAPPQLPAKDLGDQSDPSHSFSECGVFHLPDHSVGDPLLAVHQGRHRDLWRVINQPVNMVVFAVEPDQCRFEIMADRDEDLIQIVKNFLREHAPSLFFKEDQFYFHIKKYLFNGSFIFYFK